MEDDLNKVIEDSTRGSFFLMSGSALSNVIMAIGSIIVARLLTDVGYGQYTLALVVPQLLFLFADLGINQGIMRFVSNLRTKGEGYKAASLIKYSFLLKALTGVAMMIINYVFAETLASGLLQRPELTFYIQISSFAIFFQVIFSTAYSAFVGLDRTEFSALTLNMQAVTKTVVSILLVVLGLGVAGALMANVVAYLIASIGGVALLFFLMRRSMRVIDSDPKVSHGIPTLLRYGAPLYVSSLLLVGLVPFYQGFLLANFATDAAVGNYKAAVNFATLMTVLSVPITTAMLTGVSKLDSSGMRRIKVFYRLANKYSSLLVLPLMVLIITYSTEIVHIVYGADFQLAPLYLAIYCLIYLQVGLGSLTLTSLYNGLNDTRTTLVISLITFLALLVASPVMTIMWGVPGLIGAFVLATALGTLYGALRGKQKFGLRLCGIEVSIVARIYAVSIVSAVPSLLLTRFAGLSTIPSFVLGAAVYLLTYVTLIPLARVVVPSEVRSLNGIVAKVRPVGIVARPILKYVEKVLNFRNGRSKVDDTS